MNKTKSNAKWHLLTTDQQDTLEDWLFDDDLSYDDALARAHKEMEQLAQARKDPQTRKFEENKRINNLRKRMFGNDIPELLPESESEETIPSGAAPAPRGFSNARAEAPPRPPVGRHVPPNAASSNAPSSGATPGPVKRGLFSRLFSSRDTTPSPATVSPVAPIAPSVPTRPSQPAKPPVPEPTGRFPELMKLLPHQRQRMFEQNKKINDLRKGWMGIQVMGDLWPENDAELADPNFSGTHARPVGMGFGGSETAGAVSVLAPASEALTFRVDLRSSFSSSCKCASATAICEAS